MPGRKSNGTETRGQFSAGLSFQFVTPCPGHLAGDFLLIEDCGGWIEGGGNFPKGSTDEKRESQPAL